MSPRSAPLPTASRGWLGAASLVALAGILVACAKGGAEDVSGIASSRPGASAASPAPPPPPAPTGEKLDDVENRPTNPVPGPASAAPLANPVPALEPHDGCKCAPGDPLCSCNGDHPAPRRNGKRFSVQMASAKSISGRLTQDQVESVIASNLDIFSSCVQQDATLTLRALVADTGKVANVDVPTSDPDRADMRDCIRAAFQTLTFPTGNGQGVPLTFDLALHPSG